MAAVLKGVEDYLAGAEAFMKVDPEKKHKSIMKEYGASLTADMNRKKMAKMAARNIWRNWRSVGMYIKAVLMLRKRGSGDSAWAGLNTRAFWEKYLEGREM